MVREITGTGEGNGPMISFHDGFDALKNWANFLPGADRIVIGMSSRACGLLWGLSKPPSSAHQMITRTLRSMVSRTGNL